jgi:hypothetical protein
MKYKPGEVREKILEQLTEVSDVIIETQCL